MFSQHWQPYHHFSKLEAQAQILHKNLTVDLTYKGPHGGDGDIPHRSTKVCLVPTADIDADARYVRSWAKADMPDPRSNGC
jgi:hypothetical protein